jgi:hypothetical protein
VAEVNAMSDKPPTNVTVNNWLQQPAAPVRAEQRRETTWFEHYAEHARYHGVFDEYAAAYASGLTDANGYALDERHSARGALSRAMREKNSRERLVPSRSHADGLPLSQLVAVIAVICILWFLFKR